VLLDVAASAVNRADLLQRQGSYPPPPGTSDVIGLECSGTVAGLGPDVTGWRVGDQVCALLAGGGYAERVVVPAAQLMPLPHGVDLVSAAGLPEVACTVWSNMVMLAGLAAGEVLLVHGGAGGIGTHAIQVGRALGATVAATAGSPERLARCRELGADITINYREQDFVAEINATTGGRGADVVLDNMGASYLPRNVSVLATGGRLVVIGMQGGVTGELNLGMLLAKRATVAATGLRYRPVEGHDGKRRIVAAVTAGLWPLVEAGKVAPVVGRVLPMRDAAEAHRLVMAGEVVGKVLLRNG
jgi:NADPH2:quinone reductase